MKKLIKIGFLAMMISPVAQAKDYVVRSMAASFLPAEAWVENLNEEEALAKKEQGFRIEPLIRMSPYAMGNTPASDAGSSWIYGAVQSVAANRLEQGSGQGILICLVDSGVTAGVGLDPKIQAAIDLIEAGSAKENLDSIGHGTNLAAIMVGDGKVHRGIAPEAKILSVKVIDSSGVSSNLHVSRGIDRCVTEGAQVINLSMGSFLDSAIIADSIHMAKAQGVTVVAASGNDAGDISFPARMSEVLAVGSIGESFRISTFSGRGESLDLVAPGENIELLVSINGATTGAGTSFSAAIVSGVEAIRRSRSQTNLLADDLGFDATEQGQGLINAHRTALGQ